MALELVPGPPAPLFCHRWSNGFPTSSAVGRGGQEKRGAPAPPSRTFWPR